MDSDPDGHGLNVASLIDRLQKSNFSCVEVNPTKKKVGPSVPPKPLKKLVEFPQVPQSKLIKDAREPLYSKPLHGDKILLRKQPLYSTQCYEKSTNSKSTLDNPAILDQQLEALAYHKLQMERKGLLGNCLLPTTNTINTIPKLSSTSLCSNNQPAAIYINLRPELNNCFKYNYNQSENSASLLNVQQKDRFAVSNSLSRSKDSDEDMLPPPPSPVSSSYSELRRATDVFDQSQEMEEVIGNIRVVGPPASIDKSPISVNIPHTNLCDINKLKGSNFYGYCATSQTSSTYDSIYEPINPRPPQTDMSSQSNSNYSTYASYTNERNIPCCTSNPNVIPTDNININMATPSSGGLGIKEVCTKQNEQHIKKLSHSTDTDPVENYGLCFKCSERVVGENSGCTAMDQIYHIDCFTCTICQINLQGKPFYVLEGQPYCHFDYLETLEKCSVCMKPIYIRCLRATGKPYHPQCFTCVVCGNSLDGIPFTVDATNQNYCITDFHKKFAPRCCVCKDPIMPESGQEETVRVVALDRSFHLECYKCEDCGLLLSSEADGRGCYPLDDHVLCKSCNAHSCSQTVNILNIC